MLYRKKINDLIILRKETGTIESWSKTTANIYRKYYFFDVQNPDAVIKGRQKPRVIERGPYVYREVKETVNMQLHGESKLSYSPITYLYFEPDLSSGSESDIITFVNIPAAAMIDKAIKEQKRFSGSINFGFLSLNGILDYLSVKLFLKRTVGQFIHGYDDQLLQFGKVILPKIITSEKFSLLNGENGTIKENFTVMTGADDVSNLGKIVEWNGLKKLNIWDTDKANEISGNDPTLFTPFRKRSDILKIFSSTLGRSLILNYEKDEYVNDILSYKFSLQKDIFYNASVNPENDGYDYEEMGNGVHCLGRMIAGAPTYISLPHFLNADQKFINGINGLEQDVDKHDFTLNLEPITSAPVGGKGRLQINVYLNGNKNIYLAKNVKNVMLPVFWIEMTFNHHPDTINLLSQAVKIFHLLSLIPFIIVCAGCLCSMCAAFILFVIYLKNKNEKDKAEKKNVKYSEVNVKINDKKVQI